VAQKIANRLDDALISGAITQDQYLAAGGRSPDRMLQGLRRGSDSLVKNRGIQEYGNRAEFYSKPVQKGIYEKIYGQVQMPGSADWLPGLIDQKAAENIKNKTGLRSRISNFFSLRPNQGAEAYAEANTLFVDRNRRKTGLERLISALSKPRPDTAFNDEYLHELTRRHEIDEIRFAKDKLSLSAHGHNSPKIILQEHSNIMRAPKPVRDSLRLDRAYSFETPLFSSLTDGNFVYGKKMVGPKDRLAKLIADRHPTKGQALRAKFKNLFSNPNLVKTLKGII
jgi:hypothetical protein